MRKPIPCLTVDELIGLNRDVLAVTRFQGDRPHGVQSRRDLEFIVDFVETLRDEDPFEQATALSCAIIALHPFHDGNHRTSLYAAILHLILHGQVYRADPEGERALYRWRFEYEERHAMEAQWTVGMGSWDTPRREKYDYLRELSASEYGRRVHAFLRHRCRRVSLEVVFVLLPPGTFTALIRRYPKPTQKAARRMRRAEMSLLRKHWRELARVRAADKGRPRPPRQKPWVEQ